MSKIKKLLSIIISGVIFFLCAYYMVSYFQWTVIFQLLTHVDWKWMPVAVAVTILFFWLFRAMRWFVLLKAAGIHIDFFRLYLVGSISVAFALVTPLQSGEALKVELLKKIGALERVPGYGIFMTERILDLIVVLLMAVLSLIFGVSKFLDKGTMFAAVALMLICFMVFFMIIQRISPDNAVGRFFQPFNQCVRNVKILAIVIVLTIGGWLFIVLGWYASLRSISISINILETAAMTAITTLIGIFSLIPWSLGISEVSISSFLVYFKQDIPLAQAGALIVRVYGIVTLILGFIHFLVWKFIRSGKQMPVNIE
ncbi:MAG: lysylphosphatidylglycerol synthase transmembrane domain-containing protein [Deltaproteobacteria bacterium]|nr:lysylphosphatidylglycerol synthase transmembrane domain-containing protein [Deltaproteobacteria bacterium]